MHAHKVQTERSLRTGSAVSVSLAARRLVVDVSTSRGGDHRRREDPARCGAGTLPELLPRRQQDLSCCSGSDIRGRAVLAMFDDLAKEGHQRVDMRVKHELLTLPDGGRAKLFQARPVVQLLS